MVVTHFAPLTITTAHLSSRTNIQLAQLPRQRFLSCTPFRSVRMSIFGHNREICRRTSRSVGTSHNNSTGALKIVVAGDLILNPPVTNPSRHTSNVPQVLILQNMSRAQHMFESARDTMKRSGDSIKRRSRQEHLTRGSHWFRGNESGSPPYGGEP